MSQATSADPAYSALPVAEVAVVNIDDEPATAPGLIVHLPLIMR